MSWIFRTGVTQFFFSLSGDLSWRDVQHIIVRTARPGPVNINNGDWNINKAGFKGKCLNCVLLKDRC